MKATLKHKLKHGNIFDIYLIESSKSFHLQLYLRSITFQMTYLANRFIQVNRSKTFYYASVFMRVLYFYIFLFFLYFNF